MGLRALTSLTTQHFNSFKVISFTETLSASHFHSYHLFQCRRKKTTVLSAFCNIFFKYELFQICD